MPLNHDVRVFAVKSATVAKLTADPPGGVATYGASSIVKGMKKLVVGGSVNVKYLRGDSKLIASDALVDSWTGAFDHAKLNLNALGIIFSTAVVDSGTTPNQLATWSHSNADQLQWFKLEALAQSIDYPAGDLLVSLWKCKLAGIPSFGLNEEDFQLFSQPIIVAPRDADGLDWQQVIRETSVALP